MEPGAFAYFAMLAVVVMLLVTLIVRRRSDSPGWKGSTPPVVTGDVLVRGWSHDQLVEIVEKFIELYEIDATTVRDEPAQGGWTRISFSQPVDSSHLLFLVNYLHYPMDMDLTATAPVAVGRFATVDGFGPAGAPAGQQAKAYVPLKDDEHDLVFVKLADNSTFRVSFTDMKWQPQREARMSAEVRAVPFGVGPA